MELFKSAYLKLSSVKVVHSLPGRTRLQIPGIKRVPEEYRTYIVRLLHYLERIQGIKEVSLDFVTGRALVTYDNDVISEEELLKGCKAIWAMAVNELGNIGDDGEAEDEQAFMEQLEQEVAARVEEFIK